MEHWCHSLPIPEFKLLDALEVVGNKHGGEGRQVCCFILSIDGAINITIFTLSLVCNIVKDKQDTPVSRGTCSQA